MQTTLLSSTGRSLSIYLKKGLILFAAAILALLLVSRNQQSPVVHNARVLYKAPSYARIVDHMYSKRNKLASRATDPVDTATLKQTDWYHTVQKIVEERSYYLAAGQENKQYRSVNFRQQLKAEYKSTGFELSPIPSTAKERKQGDDWRLNVSVKGVYGDGRLFGSALSGIASPNAEDNRLEYKFNQGWSVQYKNDPEGIRQNFIIQKKPSAKTDRLIVQMKASPSWVVDKAHDKELHFAKKNRNGVLETRIIYNDLKAWDAKGQALACRMEVSKQNNFELITDAKNANYPITIDPLSSTPSSTLTGTSTGTLFGGAIASAGDVNGDGYSDVIVGAPETSGLTGEVFIFLGSISGLSTTAAATISGPSAGSDFGVSVASAGDINGDGYSDVIVGAPATSTNTGSVYIFEGSATGISTNETPTAILTGSTTNNYFGISVAGAGDINGDGYSDVIVGAYAAGGTGQAYIYQGSSTAISSGASPNATLSGAAIGDAFGISVASAGDVNSDGYSDVIVGAYGHATATGAAYIYEGSNSGIANGASPSATLNGPAIGADFGGSVASAGDVNGDGYSDVIVGASGVSANTGAAYIFEGGSSGIANGASPSVTLSGVTTGDKFGFSVAGAGDMNGDAFADVIVGAIGVSTSTGAAYIFEGSLAGTSTTSALIINGAATGDNFGFAVASAGDVNGDGVSDAIVGGPDNTSSTGVVNVFQGRTDFSVNPANVTYTGQNAGDRFGLSVTSAGDINGDGYSDVVVGAIGYNSITGAAYVFYGSSTGLTLSSPTILTIPYTGNQENFGWDVAGSDINGDGYSDVIVGAYAQNNEAGEVYIYLGSSAGLITTVFSTLSGQNSFDEFGYSVANAGDVNGDGYGDIIIGAPGASIPLSNNGAAYLYTGSSTGIATNAPADTLYGLNSFEGFGISVSTAGDVNGDGYSDVVVGTDGSDNAYVYYGSKTGISNDASPSVTLSGDYGNGTGGTFGISVSTAGDVNGDGFSDVIVGANTGAGNGNGAGAAGIFLGSAGGLANTASVVLDGVNAGDLFGSAVATAGDVNGDGYSDVIVRATNGTNIAGPTGTVYLYLGGPGGLNSTVAATFTDATSGASYASTEVPRRALAGAGDINGDGYSDLLVGVYEDATLGTKTGKLFVYYGNLAVGHNGSNVLKLYETNLTNPIAADNLTQDFFGLGLYVQSPFGSVKGKLVWETEPNGSPFLGNPITDNVVTTGGQSAFAQIPAGGIEFKNLVQKSNGKTTKVRTRIKYAPTATTFGQVYSPWIYSQVYLLQGNLGVVPLQLISLTAQTEMPNIVLNWKVGDDVNLSGYVVEHSLDGTNFDSLGFVVSDQSANTSNYSFTHYHPSEGIHYYRLKEVTIEGTFTNSQNVWATINGNPVFSVYPNPATDHIVISYSGQNGTYARITNAAGSLIGMYKLNGSSGQITLPVSNFARGNYFVDIPGSGFAPLQVSIP